MKVALMMEVKILIEDEEDESKELILHRNSEKIFGLS